MFELQTPTARPNDSVATNVSPAGDTAMTSYAAPIVAAWFNGTPEAAAADARRLRRARARDGYEAALARAVEPHA